MVMPSGRLMTSSPYWLTWVHRDLMVAAFDTGEALLRICSYSKQKHGDNVLSRMMKHTSCTE